MATTVFMAEIIAIGFTSMIWVVLFSLGFTPLTTNDVFALAGKFKDHAALIFLLAVVVMYQCGWVMGAFILSRRYT